jgi:hypothetical protein
VGRCRLGARLPFSDDGRAAGWAESIGSVVLDPSAPEYLCVQCK